MSHLRLSNWKTNGRHSPGPFHLRHRLEEGYVINVARCSFHVAGMIIDILNAMLRRVDRFATYIKYIK